MTRSAKWARTALSGTCRAFFGAYRGFAKQSLEGKFSEVHLTHILGPAEVGCWVADKIGGDHGLRERGRTAPAYQRAGAQEHRRRLARAAGRLYREDYELGNGHLLVQE